MAKKKTFDKVTAVKDAARATVGTPRATKAIPDAKSRAETRATKYKKTQAQILEEE